MNEPTRFLLVGAYNTAFGYVSFVVLYQCLHDVLHYLLIAAASHAIAVVNSFLLQRWIVFRDSGPAIPAFLRFNVATGGTLILGLAGIAILVDGVGIHPLVAQAIVTLTSVVAVYLAHKHYTFRRRVKHPADD